MTGGVRADRVGRMRRKPPGPWPVKPRLAVGSFLVVSRPSGPEGWAKAPSQPDWKAMLARSLLKGSDAGRGPRQRCRCPSAPERTVEAERAPGSQDPGITRLEDEGEAAVTRDPASRRKLRFQGAGVHQARACADAGLPWRAERESARSGARAPGWDIGDRSSPRLCSRGVWVAEVDEQRLVPAASQRQAPCRKAP